MPFPFGDDPIDTDDEDDGVADEQKLIAKTGTTRVRRAKAALNTPEARQKFLVDESIRQGVDPAVTGAIAISENTAKMHSRTSPKGARGPMQIIPGTAQRIARELKVRPEDILNDDETNIRAGVYETKRLLLQSQRHEDPVGAAAVGYNAGEGEIRRYNAKSGHHPFAETRNYVSAVKKRMEALDKHEPLQSYLSQRIKRGQNGSPTSRDLRNPSESRESATEARSTVIPDTQDTFGKQAKAAAGTDLVEERPRYSGAQPRPGDVDTRDRMGAQAKAASTQEEQAATEQRQPVGPPLELTDVRRPDVTERLSSIPGYRPQQPASGQRIIRDRTDREVSAPPRTGVRPLQPSTPDARTVILTADEESDVRERARRFGVPPEDALRVAREEKLTKGLLGEVTGTPSVTTVEPVTEESLAKKKLQLDILGMKQVESAVEIPGYKEAIGEYNQDVQRFNLENQAGQAQPVAAHPEQTAGQITQESAQASVPAGTVINLGDHIQPGAPAPTPQIIGQKVYQSMGFSDEEATAYAQQHGFADPASAFYQPADDNSMRVLLDRAKEDVAFRVSLPDLSPQASRQKQQWLADFRAQKRAAAAAKTRREELELLSVMSPELRNSLSPHFALQQEQAGTPLTDEEKAMLGVETVPVLSDIGTMIRSAGEHFVAPTLKGTGRAFGSSILQDFGQYIETTSREREALLGRKGVLGDVEKIAGAIIPAFLTGSIGAVAGLSGVQAYGRGDSAVSAAAQGALTYLTLKGAAALVARMTPSNVFTLQAFSNEEIKALDQAVLKGTMSADEAAAATQLEGARRISEAGKFFSPDKAPIGMVEGDARFLQAEIAAGRMTPEVAAQIADDVVAAQAAAAQGASTLYEGATVTPFLHKALVKAVSTGIYAGAFTVQGMAQGQAPTPESIVHNLITAAAAEAVGLAGEGIKGLKGKTGTERAEITEASRTGEIAPEGRPERLVTEGAEPPVGVKIPEPKPTEPPSPKKPEVPEGPTWLEKMAAEDLAQKKQAREAEKAKAKEELSAELAAERTREAIARRKAARSEKKGAPYAIQPREAIETQPEVEARPEAVVEPKSEAIQQEVLKEALVDIKAHEASTSPTNDKPEPTLAQIEAGNYDKGHVKVAGLNISIENPEGSIRSGVDADGKPWELDIRDGHYGYIRGTKGKDKEHIDVFVKPQTREDYEGPVFVANQNKKGTGTFDEHKVMLGYASADEAEKAYLENYDEETGPEILRSIARFDSVDKFKTWLKEGDHQRPAQSNAIQGLLLGGTDVEVSDSRDRVSGVRGAPASGAVEDEPATQQRLNAGDIVTHPDFAGGKALEVFSAFGNKIELRRADGQGKTLTVAADSPIGRGFRLAVRARPAPEPVEPSAVTGAMAGGETESAPTTEEVPDRKWLRVYMDDGMTIEKATALWKTEKARAAGVSEGQIRRSPKEAKPTLLSKEPPGGFTEADRVPDNLRRGFKAEGEPPDRTVKKVGLSYVAPDGTAFTGRYGKRRAQEYARAKAYEGATVRSYGGGRDLVEKVIVDEKETFRVQYQVKDLDTGKSRTHATPISDKDVLAWPEKTPESKEYARAEAYQAQVKQLVDTVKEGDEYLTNGRTEIVMRAKADGVHLKYVGASQPHRAISYGRLADQLNSGEMKPLGKLQLTSIETGKTEEAKLKEAAPQSFKVQMPDGTSNGQRWATEKEADIAARELESRWTAMPSGWKVVPSNDPVNYRWDDEAYKGVPITELRTISVNLREGTTSEKTTQVETAPEEEPKVTWKKAAIVPTREGVKAIPIEEETPEQRRARLADKAKAIYNKKPSGGAAGMPNIGETDEPPALDPELREIIAEIARTFIEEGRTEFDELVEEFENLLGEDLFDAVADELPNIVAIEAGKVQTERNERQSLQPTEEEVRGTRQPAAEGLGGDRGEALAGEPPDVLPGTEGEQSATPGGSAGPGTSSGQIQPVGGGRGPSRSGAGTGDEGVSVSGPGGSAGLGEPDGAGVRQPAPGPRKRTGGKLDSQRLVESDVSEADRKDDQVRVSTESLASDFIATRPEQIGAGGAKTKFRNNIRAIETLRKIEGEDRTVATPEEQEILARFVGWGMFPQLFKGLINPNKMFTDYSQRQEFDKDTDAWATEADELRALLSEEEFESAFKSTLNAHYTHPQIVMGMWEMLRNMGFKHGKLLEPALGSGNFFAMMPADMRGKSNLSGVEIDKVTGKIAKLLYPSFNVQVKGYEEVKVPNDFYDLIISNVPFGKYGVFDTEYSRVIPKASIHDYYFIKSLDKVRPGGLVMFITSAYTMDKNDSTIRDLIRSKADLVAAFRLPDGAFEKNAGTAVVTDLIILQKRAPNTDPGGPAWSNIGQVPNPDFAEDPYNESPRFVPINEYYVKNPDNVLGRVDRKSRMYSKNAPHVSLTDDFNERWQRAIMGVPEKTYRPAERSKKAFEPQRLEASEDLKENNLVVKDKKLWQKKGDHIVERPVPGHLKGKDRQEYIDRISGMVEIRSAIRTVFNTQLNAEETDEARENARSDLNKIYDKFVKKWGPLSQKKNSRLFYDDPDAPTLLALENWNPATQTAAKRPIFTQDVIARAKRPDAAENAQDALTISLVESGTLDLDRMQELLGGRPMEDITSELVQKALAYNDPKHGWVTPEEYLSGNVKRKLLEAREAALSDPAYQPNVEALEKVQPPDVSYDEIRVRLGAPWIDPDDISDFMRELMSGSKQDFEVGYVPSNGKWMVHYTDKGREKHKGRSADVELYGTERAPFMTIMQNALDGRTIKIYDPGDKEGSRVYNKEESDNANGKVQSVREKFAEWIWKDDERRARLHRSYNDTFNVTRNTEWDGKHLTIDPEHSVLRGMDPGIKLRKHQVDAIWRTVVTGRVVYNHEVGTGKTFTMIGSAMELRRMGLARKPAIACLKANIEAVTADARKLYPAAKIISIEGQFQQANRRRTISQIATGDYDLVLLTHDNLNMLGMSGANEARFIQEELDQLRAVLQAARDEEESANAGDYSYGRRQKRYESRLVKQLAKMAEELEVRLKTALNRKNQDTNVTFEETGIDFLFVDESHHYKSLPVYTRMEGVKGIPTNKANRAITMLMRVRWMLEQGNQRGLVFATGTPIANTLAELFNIQRYLQFPDLQARGIDSFDAWAKNFTVETTKMMMHFTGGFGPETRLDEFINVAELQQLAMEIFDSQMADDLPEIKRPDREDLAHTSPMSRLQRLYMLRLRARMEAIRARKGPPQKGDDIPLTVNNDARKMSIDMRLVIPGAPDNPDSKINLMVKRALKVHEEDPKAVQLIFLDLGVHPTKWGFSVYSDIIDKLVAGGIPENKIINFAKMANTEAGKAAKVAGQERLRSGDALFGIGSTAKLGTGVNVQDLLSDIHQLDSQYVPANVDQRIGRIIRQGNTYETGRNNTYVTAGSIDARLWSLVGRKGQFIKQFLKGQSTNREMKLEEGDEISPELLSAIASGNPLLVEKIQLDEDVKNLTAAKKRHEASDYAFRDSVNKVKRKIKDAESDFEALKEDKATYDAHAQDPIEVDGVKYDDPIEGVRAMQEAFTKASGRRDKDWNDIEIGVYKGFPVQRQANSGNRRMIGVAKPYNFSFAWDKEPLLDEKGQPVIKVVREQMPGGKFRDRYIRMEKPDGSWTLDANEYVVEPGHRYKDIMGGIATVADVEKAGGGTRVHYDIDEAQFKNVLNAEQSLSNLENALQGWNGIDKTLRSTGSFLEAEHANIQKMEKEIGKPFKQQESLDTMQRQLTDLNARIAAGEGQESDDQTKRVRHDISWEFNKGKRQRMFQRTPVFVGDIFKLPAEKPEDPPILYVLTYNGTYPEAEQLDTGSGIKFNSREEFEDRTGRPIADIHKDEFAEGLRSLSLTPTAEEVEESLKEAEQEEKRLEGEEVDEEMPGKSGAAGMPEMEAPHYSAYQPRTEAGQFAGAPERPAPPIAEHSDIEDQAEYEAEALGNMAQLQMSSSPEPGFENRKVSSTDVIKAYEAVFDKIERPTPIRVGRIAERKAAGIYKPHAEVVRMKAANDIPTAAHEIGHALQNVLYNTVKHTALKVLPFRARKELVALGKALYGSRRPNYGYGVEGWAEFIRHYLSTDNVANVAPRTLKFFAENVLPANPEIAEALTKAREITDAYRKEGAAQRAKANMQGKQATGPKIANALRDLADNLPTEWVDAFTPLLRLSRTAERLAGQPLRPSEDPYQLATAYSMTAGAKVYYMIFNGMLDAAGNKVGPPLQDAMYLRMAPTLPSVADQREEFTAFLWARQALEYWDKGMDPGMTRHDALFLVNQLGNAAFELAAQEVYDWNDGILSYVSQLVPELGPSIAQMRRKWRHYVPLARVFDEPSREMVSRLQKVSTAANPFKRRTGSGRRVQDIFPQMIANAEKLVAMAHKRAVLHAVIKLARIKGMGSIIEEVPRDKVRTAFQIEQIATQLEAAGADLSSVNLDDIVTLFLPAYFPKSDGDPIIPYKDSAGKMHWYQVSGELYQTLSGMDIYRLGRFWDLVAGVPTRIFRAGTTAYRAAFSLVRNPARDLQTFIAQTRNQKNPAALAAAYFRGMMEAMNPGRFAGKGSPNYDLFIRLGANVANQLGADIEAARRPASELFQGKTMRVVRHPMEALRELLSITESGPRVAELIGLADQVGWDRRSPLTMDQMVQMSIASAEVTVNFKAMGRIARVVNQCVPFFNANLQGSRSFLKKLRQAATGEGGGRGWGWYAILRAVVAFTLPTLYLWWKNKDEDWYQDMPDREKFMYYHIRVSDKVIFRIPRAFEWGNLFSVVPEAVIDSWYRKDPEGVKGALGHILETSTPPITPVIVRNAKEQWQNRIAFFDMPIVPRGEEDLPPGEQRGPYTTKIAAWLGEKFPNTISPRRVDALAQGIGGGVAKDVMELAGRISPKAEREREASDIPVLGTAFRRGGEAGVGSKAIDKFYDEYNEALQRSNSKVLRQTPADRERLRLLQNARDALKLLRKAASVTPDLKQRQEIQDRMVTVAKSAIAVAEHHRQTAMK